MDCGKREFRLLDSSLIQKKRKILQSRRQNFGHILALKNRLREFPNIKYISIVVFPAKAKIKVITCTEVTNSYNILNVIKRHSDVTLTNNEKEKIFQKINSTNSRSTYQKDQHIKSIKQKIQRREDAILEKNVLNVAKT